MIYAIPIKFNSEIQKGEFIECVIFRRFNVTAKQIKAIRQLVITLVICRLLLKYIF